MTRKLAGVRRESLGALLRYFEETATESAKFSIGGEWRRVYLSEVEAEAREREAMEGLGS